MDPKSLFDGKTLKLIFFGGKGGVGKTSCAVSYSLAIASSRPESRFLLVSTDPAHSIDDSLDGFRPPPNLTIRRIDAAECLEKFKVENREKLRQIALRGTFFDESDIESILNLSLPGLDELMGFLEIADSASSDEFESIFVDTAPTGHTLRLLEMPKLVGSWLEALDALLAKHRYMKKLFGGAYQKDAIDLFLTELSDSVKRMEALLSNRKKSRFAPVLIPEPLSLFETENLISSLHSARLPISDIVVNRIYPENECPVCSDTRRRQLSCLADFSRMLSEYRLWGIPMYSDEVGGNLLTEGFWQGAYELDIGEKAPFDEPLELPSNAKVENPAPFPVKDLKLIIFAGKGGVGKTTLACSTACGLAKKYEDKEIFLFSTDPAHSISQCLKKTIGSNPVKVSPRLTAMEIDAQKSFRELKQTYADELEKFLGRFSAQMDFAFDQQAMEQLMDLAPPGIDEVMALNMAMEYMAGGQYDLLVLDSAPTGHLLRLLETPEIMDLWLKNIFGIFLKYKNMFRLPGLSKKMVEMSKELKILRETLSNRNKSAIYAVSILTRMALEETCDLISSCKSMGVNTPVLFMNMATPNSPCDLCSSVFKREKTVEKKFGELFPDLFRTVIYRYPDPSGLEKLERLASAIYEETRDETVEVFAS